MKKLIVIAAGILMISCSKPKPTIVLVLPTLHAAHETNTKYTYDDLMQVIKAYAPDAIGVEIRPEDMFLNSDTLDLFYPIEMIRVRDSFPGNVTGIDYYTEDTRGRRVSRKIFTDTTTQMGRLKLLLNKMKADPTLTEKFELAGIPKIHQEQRRIALNCSANDFLKGEYDSLTERQYFLEDSLYKNTVYEEYSHLNNRRDLEITRNALAVVRKNPSKKVLILVGANHRNRLVDSLEKDASVLMVKNLDFIENKDAQNRTGLD